MGVARYRTYTDLGVVDGIAREIMTGSCVFDLPLIDRLMN